MSATVGESRGEGRAARLPVIVLVVAACASLARAYETPIPWVFAALAAASLWLRIELGPRALRAIAVGTWIAVGAAAATSWALMVVAIAKGPSTDDALLVCGGTLSIAAALLSLARARSGLTIVAALGALLVAAQDRRADLELHLAAAAGALVAHLAIGVERGAVAAGPRRAPRVRRAIVAVAALGLAIAIASALPVAQQRLEELAFAVLTPKGTAKTGVGGDEVRLGQFESLARSDEIALRVWTAKPGKLRARAYVRFDGRSWFATSIPVEPAVEIDAPLGPGLVEAERFPGRLRIVPDRVATDLVAADAHVARVVPVGLDEGVLVAPGGAVAVKADVPLRIDVAAMVHPPVEGGVDAYAVIFRDRGAADDRTVDPALLDAALAAPSKVDARVHALAREIAASSATPSDRIRATIERVRSMARYSLEDGPTSPTDPVAEFLFEKKQGWCEHFASATALLLRLQGVPARYVTGFEVDETSRAGGHIVVRESDAHAWVEAWVQGVGWIEADATPPSEGPRGPRARALSTRISEALRAWLAEATLTARTFPVSAALRAVVAPASALAAIVLLAAAIRRAHRHAAERHATRLSRASITPAAATALCVDRIDRAFAARGHPRPKARGLREHADELERRGLPRADLLAFRRAIDCVHRAVFGGEAVPVSELRAVVRALEVAPEPRPTPRPAPLVQTADAARPSAVP